MIVGRLQSGVWIRINANQFMEDTTFTHPKEGIKRSRGIKLCKRGI